MTEKEVFRPARRDMFEATRKWNKLVGQFCSTMPTKRHTRSHIWSYEESFTGKEATDHLLTFLGKIYPGKDKRESAVKVLGKMLEKGLFYNCREENDAEFKDNAKLYKFCPEKIKTELEFSTPMTTGHRRTSSCHGRLSTCNEFLVKTLPQPTFGGSDSTKPVMQPALNGRLSCSSGDIAALCKKAADNSNAEPTFISTYTLKTSMGSRPRVVATIAENDEKEYDAPVRTLRIRNVSETPSLPPAPSKNLVERLPVPSVEQNAWLQAVLARLRSVGCLQLNDYLKELRAADVEWNCTHVGHRGIVQLPLRKDDLPSHVYHMLRYLSRFPFQRIPAADYRGIELDTFRNIEKYLHETAPVLPHKFAEAIMTLVEYFQARVKARNCSASANSKGLGTPSNMPVPPASANPETFNRHYQYRVPVYRRPAATPVSTSTNNNASAFARTRERMTMHTSSPSTASPRILAYSRRSKSPSYERDLEHSGVDGRSLRDVLDEYAPFPGLRQTDATRRKFQELYLSPEAQAPFIDSPNSSGAPFAAGKSPAGATHDQLLMTMLKEDHKTFVDAMQLYLVTLPTIRRRHLHVLLNYLKRIADNATLKLSADGNKCFLLTHLSTSIVEPCGSITEVQSFRLVTFLMDNVAELFKVPDYLSKDVQQIHERAMQSRRSSEAPVRYCSPVPQDEQTRVQEECLLQLLDSIVKDENLAPDTRKRHLKEFQKVHPHIYAKRFPERCVTPDPSSSVPLPTRGSSSASRIINKINRSLHRLF